MALMGAAPAAPAAFAIFVPVVPTTAPFYVIHPPCGIRNLSPAQLAELKQRIPIVASVSCAATGWWGVAYVPPSNLSGVSG